MPPRFSAIIPTFNRWRLAQDAVESALAQTYACHEIIVVDDGSSDGTAEKLGQLFGDRIRLITKPNGGVSTARNAGISAATGDYIAYLDSDDLWKPTKLELAAQTISAIGAAPALIFSDFHRFDTRTGEFYPQTNTQLFPRIFHHFSGNSGKTFSANGAAALHCVIDDYPFFPSTFIIHREIHDNYRWDPGVLYSEDFNFVAKVAGRYPMIYIDMPLATIRMHGDNKSANWKAKMESHIATLATLQARCANDRGNLASIRVALGRRQMSAARQLSRIREYGTAARYALQALSHPPYVRSAACNLYRSRIAKLRTAK